jgi:cytochrome c peroxidase
MKRAILVAALAACGNAAAPAGAPCDLDPALDDADCAAVHAMALPPLPPARGNAKGDDPDAAGLGFSMFFDARLSKGEAVRCATCHEPEKKFGDGLPTSTGLARTTRNAPTMLNAARMEQVFWDGRADSVWSQPLFALENPLEMDFTRLELAHAVALRYAASYTKVFGPLPPLDDATRFPARGKPGDAAWDGMTAADRDAIDLVAANVGKSFEAYVRKLAAGPAAFDRFLGGDASALSDDQRAGLVAFAKNGCANCHSGPTLSDQRFHALGVPAWPGDPVDVGREGAYAVLAASPFTASGDYWDGPKESVALAASAQDQGAFRTPSLRNVIGSAPYGHDGRFSTLADVIDFHGAIDPADRDAIVTFLGALDGAYPLPPWNDWPQH